MLIKKRFLTLIEMLIAISLTTMLLTLLAYFFRDFDLLNTYSEKMQTESFYSRYAQNRLASVCATAHPEYVGKDEPFFFFTTPEKKGFLSNSPSLAFIFNNGPNDEAGDLQLARLFVNNNSQLCLASWPIHKKWRDSPIPENPHLEILMEKVEKISFSFFAAPERDRKLVVESLPKKNQNEHPQISASNDCWTSEWKQEYKHLPPFFKMAIHKKTEKEEKQEPINFSFILPLSQKIIINEIDQ